MIKKVYLFLFLFIFTLLNAQDTTSDSNSEDWKTNSEAFLKKTIAEDLIQSNLEQLKKLANSLNIYVENNNLKAYQDALAKHYGITLISPKQRLGDRIILERAGELKIFKISEGDIEQESIQIIGKAKIVFEGENRTIEAEEIFVDLDNKEIMGNGKVIFKDDTLEFHGNQFYYNFDVNRGILFAGRTQLLKTGNSGLQNAYFIGEKIIQTGKEEAVLYNGKLTICDEEDPHFSLNVSRIWINEDGEWGLFSGRVDIGPIPFFYIPIYYHPKNLKVYTGMGYRSKDGWYIHTTYNLLGNRSNLGDLSDDMITTIADSHMPFVSTDYYNFSSSNYNSIYKNTISDRKKISWNKFRSFDISWRIFADAYTNLGFYWGTFFYLNFINDKTPFSLSLLSDYALSRVLWQDSETGLYYPYSSDDLTNFDADSTYLNLYNFLFRSSQWLNLTGSFSQNFKFNYALQLDYATDSDYFNDFYRRQLDFSYTDLGFDLMGFMIKFRGQDADIFKEEELATITEPTNLYSFLNFTNIQPLSYPDIYGFQPLSKAEFDINSTIDLEQATNVVPAYSETTLGTAYHPFTDRYMLDTIKLPEITAELSGEIFNLKKILTFPQEIMNTRNNKKRKEQKNSHDFTQLYLNLDKEQEKTDSREKIDYKELLPFLSIKTFQRKRTDEKSVFNELSLSIASLPNIDSVSDLTDQTDKNSKDYREIVTPDVQNISTQRVAISFIDFVVNYSVTESFLHSFLFNKDLPYDILQKQEESNDFDWRQYDSFQLFLLGKFNNNWEYFLKESNIYQDLDFTITSSFDFINFKNNGIISLDSIFTVDQIKYWYNYNIYYNYLKANEYSSTDISSYTATRTETDQKKSTLSLFFENVMINDLSFGKELIEGTQILTNFKYRIYTINDWIYSNWLNLEKNVNSISLYSDQNEYFISSDSLIYYDNALLYDNIEQLDTTLTFKMNLLPSDHNHQVSWDMGPKINWVIPSSTYTTLKDEIFYSYWSDESDDWGFAGNDDSLSVLKDYYCREKIEFWEELRNRYYDSYNFWGIGEQTSEIDSPRYFREMFENITFNLNYSYTLDQKQIIKFDYQLKFVFANIGTFSSGFNIGDPYEDEATANELNDNWETYFGMYPDNQLTLTLFDSAIIYTFNHAFAKDINKFIESEIDSSHSNLDVFNVMTFTQSHTFQFNLKGDLFPVQLPSGNWLEFKSVSTFKYNYDFISESEIYNDKYVYHLDSQEFGLGLLMNILSVNLKMQAFNFVNQGYGLTLHSGNVKLEHNIVEIPTFLKYFRLELTPSIDFHFELMHDAYWTNNDGDSGETENFSSSYYLNNYLLASLNLSLIIGEGKDFETTIKFGISSKNEKMYKLYDEPQPFRAFLDDIGKSFNFANKSDRQKSDFNLEKIYVSVNHGLHDWNLSFEYIGEPTQDTIRNKFVWENTFVFQIIWKISSTNQLMKLLNKTKVDEKYEAGQWRQPIISLDEDTTTTD
ncbi:MAG: hypothetical protein MJB14_05260 [Spirochaetes bacterium]|nr:hypothetical protein [Spirochaetota bacterium]